MTQSKEPNLVVPREQSSINSLVTPKAPTANPLGIVAVADLIGTPGTTLATDAADLIRSFTRPNAAPERDLPQMQISKTALNQFTPQTVEHNAMSIVALAQQFRMAKAA